jgi:hypothetical protein
MRLYAAVLLAATVPRLASAQILQATLSNVGFYGGASASGSFTFDPSALLILSSSVTLTDPAHGYTAPLSDVQNSAIIVHSSPVSFLEFVLVNQKPTGKCYLGHQCGSTYVSLTVLGSLATIESPGIFNLVCALCGNPGEGLYASSDIVVEPTYGGGSAITTPGQLIVVNSQPAITLTFPVQSDTIYCNPNGTNPSGTCTPLTANVSAVFDHNQSAPYVKGKVITAFTGERGVCNPNATNQYQKVWSPFGTKGHGGFAKASGQPFVVNGNYYVPTTEVTPISDCPSTTSIGSAPENLYLFYDGHPGYDYPFNFGTPVYPAVSGCVSYQINAAGPNGGYGQGPAHTLAIVPLSTEPPGGICSQPYTSEGDVVFYMHLSSYVAGNQISACSSPPNPKGGTTPTCPQALVVQCTTCPTEGMWVSTDPSVTPNPIAYVGNFFSGVWGGVPTHLHVEVDLLTGQLPNPPVTGVPVDPYGWDTHVGVDPYSTSHSGVLNVWLWQQSPPY